MPITITVGVYEDASYNGTNHPKITVLGNVLAGVSETSSAAHSGAEAWEQLSVQVTPTESGNLQFVVEGQGSLGSYYVDDIAAAT